MTKINTTFTVTNTTTHKTTTVKGFVLNGILHADGLALARSQGQTCGSHDHEVYPGHLNDWRDLVACYNGNRVQFVRLADGSYMAVNDLQASRGVYAGTDWGWNRVAVTVG